MVAVTKKRILPFGVSQKWIDDRDAQRDEKVEAMLQTIENQRRLIQQLQNQIADLSAGRTRKTSRRNTSSGRPRAKKIVQHNGVVHYSLSFVAERAGIHVSNVTRQMNRLGIAPELIGGTYYISAPQAQQIKRARNR